MQPLKCISFPFGSVLMCAVIFATFLMVGCGRNGPERVVVCGKISYNGKPLTEGTVRFVPTETSQVPGAGAPITDGMFRADINGGVPVGTHKVVIEAFRTLPKRTADPFERPVRIPCIPERYSNANTPFDITIPPGSGEIAKDFEVAD